jgi:hypothetical protein
LRGSPALPDLRRSPPLTDRRHLVANVYTAQHQAGCSTNIKKDPALMQTSESHANDVLNDRFDRDLGFDGSTLQSRTAAAGFEGKVTQTVDINSALAINNLDVINQWPYNPVDFAIMSDCANTAIGV